MGAALEQAFAALKRDGSSTRLGVPLFEFRKFSELMGFDRIAEFDRKYGERG